MTEVEDFVEFLAQRDDRELTQAATKLAEKAFRKVWNCLTEAVAIHGSADTARLFRVSTNTVLRWEDDARAAPERGTVGPPSA